VRKHWRVSARRTARAKSTFLDDRREWPKPIKANSHRRRDLVTSIATTVPASDFLNPGHANILSGRSGFFELIAEYDVLSWPTAARHVLDQIGEADGLEIGNIGSTRFIPNLQAPESDRIVPAFRRGRGKNAAVSCFARAASRAVLIFWFSTTTTNRQPFDTGSIEWWRAFLARYPAPVCRHTRSLCFSIGWRRGSSSVRAAVHQLHGN